MRLLDGETIYNATDLVGFAACAHLTQLELSAARGERKRPQRDDPLLDILSRKGSEHEANVLSAYPKGNHAIAPIKVDMSTRAGLEAAAAETIAAMTKGAPVIYQATFLHDNWVGHADFLERVEQPSALGAWSYEVADAKLARSVKAAALVQLCEYSEHVTRIQQRPPVQMRVITGDRERHSFRVADYGAYHRTLKSRFRETTQAPTPAETYPDPINHCGICRWWADCRDRRRADDHLSLVAWMRRDQTKRLVEAGITTRRALAEAADELPGSKISRDAYEKLHRQAALQVRGEGQVPPLYELLEPEADDPDLGPRGLAALSAPSAGDLFLDLEGDPYALDDGLEYLFGLVEVVDGERKYHAFWAHTRRAEREAFEAAVDLIVERRRQYPDMHVYHYAAYEQTAFRRLMGAHGTREDEIDNFLRGEVFVDLYRVVRQGIRVSTESYSLKEVEKLYFTRPPGEVMNAGSSIITYEQYLVNDDHKLLDEIALYNRDDCESLVGLQVWLEARRVDAEHTFGPIPRPTPPVDETEYTPDANAVIAARLLSGVPDDVAERNADQQGRWVLAHLLEWHRREAKPEWWRYFDRCEYDTAEYVDDSECIGGLVLDTVVGPDKSSTVYRMRFEPQEHKFRVGSKPVDPATGKEAGTILSIDEAGTLEFKRGKARNAHPLPAAFIPGKPLPNNAQRAAITEVAAWVADHGLDAPGPYQAARDLLLRRPPRILDTVPGELLRAANEDTLAAGCRLVLALDSGCLAIQGPPGSGKTYTGARMIVALLDAGKRVGIAATTHSAIGNLLSEVAEAASEAHLPVRGMQKADEEQTTATPGVEVVADAGKIEMALADGSIHLAAGTAWLWAREGLRNAIDVLVVDEAGQMSLADVIAIGTATHNLVLLGDPQQLAQPSKGAHPDGAEASVLEHLLGEHDTIPDDRGLFLDLTYRMHPSVCAYISEIAYDDRLASVSDLRQQLVDGAAGLWFVPVSHHGCSTRSEDEAQAVAALIAALVGTPWTDRHGHTRPLALDDIIVIAPYNLHVTAIKARVPAGTRVGTVDKFQGREGAVAIYSTASSSAEEAPRGMDFLYDLNRLNVAVSRARARAYIVASPELLRVLCQNPRQLHLANALCRYVEYAGPHSTETQG